MPVTSDPGRVVEAWPGMLFGKDDWFELDAAARVTFGSVGSPGL